MGGSTRNLPCLLKSEEIVLVRYDAPNLIDLLAAVHQTSPLPLSPRSGGSKQQFCEYDNRTESPPTVDLGMHGEYGECDLPHLVCLEGEHNEESIEAGEAKTEVLENQSGLVAGGPHTSSVEDEEEEDNPSGSTWSPGEEDQSLSKESLCSDGRSTNIKSGEDERVVCTLRSTPKKV